MFSGAMFSSGFAESSDQTVKIQDIHADLMRNIIGFLETGQISINGESVFDFLECAGMLQIESLLRKCTHYVIKNLSIENAVDVFQTSLHLSLEELFSKATQFILLHFNQLSHLTKLHKLTFKEFQYLLTHEHLPLTDNSELHTLLDQWIESDKEQRQPLRPKICQTIETIKRKSRVFPCCIGRYKKTPYVFLYNTDEDRLEKLVSLQGKATTSSSPGGDCVTACGFKVFSNGIGHSQFYVLGGEFGQFGKGKWNLNVWKYDTIDGEFTKVFELDDPVRHFTTASDSDQFFVIGGFGRHRIILDSVHRYHQKSETLETEIIKPLPFSMYSVAAFYHDKLYVLKNSNQMWYFDCHKNNWEKAFSNVDFSQQVIEFSFALYYEGHIYASARHQHKLYSFPLESDRVVQVTEIGTFQEEAQNLTLVDSKIFNFSSDQFDYFSTIECYDLQSRTFSTVFKSEDQDIDFSPYYSFGCFPFSMLPRYQIPSFAYKSQEDEES